MPRPLLPPTGIYIPIGIVFDLEINPAMFRTWCQLRSMAWGKKETPSFTIDQLAVMTGNKQSTIYGHMAALRDRGALRWRTADRGTLIVSFPELDPPQVDDYQLVNHDFGAPDFQNTGINLQDSRKLEMPYPSFSSDPREGSSSSLSAEESLSKDRESLEEEGWANFQNSGIGFQISGNDGSQVSEIQVSGQQSIQISGIVPVREAGIQDSGRQESENLGSVKEPEGVVRDSKSTVPVQLYRSIAGYSPNASQRRRIISLVTDMQIWRATLYHWLAHGWNPRNLTGMLELYGRGGPEGCRVCKRGVPQGYSGGHTSGNQALDYLEELSREWSHGEAHGES